MLWGEAEEWPQQLGVAASIQVEFEKGEALKDEVWSLEDEALAWR